MDDLKTVADGSDPAAGGAVSNLAQQIAEQSRQSTPPPTGNGGDGGYGHTAAVAGSISQIGKKVVENLPAGEQQQQQHQGQDQQQDQQQDQNSNPNGGLRARSPDGDTSSSYSNLGISSSSQPPPTSGDTLAQAPIGANGDGDGDGGHIAIGKDEGVEQAVTPSSDPATKAQENGGVAEEVKKGIESLGRLVQAQAQTQGNGGLAQGKSATVQEAETGTMSEEQMRALEEKRAEDEAKALI